MIIYVTGHRNNPYLSAQLKNGDIIIKEKKVFMIDDIPEKEPEYKFKLPIFVAEKVLGRYQPQLNWLDFSQEYVIYIDIKRIFKYCIDSSMFFEQVFSHVVSHEHIHHLLLTIIGKYENECFDNLFGKIPLISKYVYSGIKFEGGLSYIDILPKRHFCTQTIYSIINKIRMVIKKMRKIIKMRKAIVMLSLLILIVGVVGASVFVYFGTLESEITVKQAIRLDRNKYDNTIEETFDVIGGDKINSSHILTNGGMVDANIFMDSIGLPDGITISLHYVNGTEFTLPITLNSGIDLDFILQYSIDLNIIGGQYLVKNYFRAEEI